MSVVILHTARTALSQLVPRVEAGEEIVLARGKEPVARLVPFHKPATKRRFGAMRDVLNVGPAFFEPLPAEELDRWGQ